MSHKGLVGEGRAGGGELKVGVAGESRKSGN